MIGCGLTTGSLGCLLKLSHPMEADALLLVLLMLIQAHCLMLNADTDSRNQRRRYQCSTPDIKDVRYFIGEECCDKKLAQIIGNSFVTGINLTLEDTLAIVQKKAQESVHLSFEAVGSYGKILGASHYKGIRSCLVRLGPISVLLYETPTPYDINDKRAEQAFDHLNSETLYFDNLLETSLIELPPAAEKLEQITSKRGHRQAINDTLPPGTHCDHHIRGGNKCCNGIIYQEMLEAIDKTKLTKRNTKSFGALTYFMKKHTQHVLNLAMEVFVSNSDFQIASYHVGDNICKFNYKGKYFMVYENPQQSHFDIENPKAEKLFDLHDRRDPLGTKQKEIDKIAKSEKGWKIAQSGKRKGFPMGTHCTEERTGSRCCSLSLFHAIDRAVTEEKKRKDYNPLDRRKMATAIRNAAEDILGTNMEVIVASDDFAYSSHSRGDRMCKIQTGDYHIMVYATPRSKRSYPMHYEEYNDIGRQSKVGCEENNITYLEGFACCSPRLHFELLKVVDLSSGIAQVELSRNVARTVQRIFDTRFETVTSQSDFVWSSPGRDYRYCKVSIHGVHVLTFQSSHLPPLPMEFESTDIVQVPLTAAEIAASAAVPISPFAAPFAPFAPQFGVPPNFAPPNFAPPQFGPPMGQFGPGQFGPQPGQFGPQPGQFGPQPGQVGPQPGQFGPQPGQYGPGQSYGGASTVSPNTDGGYNCFSKDSWVITPTGNKRIGELTEGEFVLTADDSKAIFAPLTMWLHKENNTEASFLRIWTEHENLLHLTNKHLIMRGECSNETVKSLPSLGEAIFAEELKEMDCLFVYAEGQWKLDKIKEISSIRQMGVYSPLTENGRIVVNGILASCYSNLKNSLLQNTFFELAYRLRSIFAFAQEDLLQNTVTLPSAISLVDNMFQFISPQSF